MAKLIAAASRGRADQLRELLEAEDPALSDCASAVYADASGSSALHVASEKGFAECVELLLRAGAQVGQANCDSMTPLLLACENGRASCCNALLQAKASVAQTDGHGRTPLHAACQLGSVESVKLLLSHQPSLDVTDWQGATPLLTAASHGHAACVRLLAAAVRENIEADPASPPGPSSPLPEVEAASPAACGQHLTWAGACDEVVSSLNCSVGLSSQPSSLPQELPPVCAAAATAGEAAAAASAAAQAEGASSAAAPHTPRADPAASPRSPSTLGEGAGGKAGAPSSLPPLHKPGKSPNPTRPVRKLAASQSTPALLASVFPEATRQQTLPARVLKAADRFDRAHRAWHGRAERLLDALSVDPTSSRAAEQLQSSMEEIRRTKFYVPEAAATAKPVAARPRKAAAPTPKKSTWSLPTSIWAPRAKWCDGKSFYDTDEVERRKFDLLWRRGLAEEGLQKFIVRHDDDEAADEDGDGMYDEVEEAEAVLWDFHDVMFMLFDYYAQIGQSTGLDSISFNAFALMIDECKIASRKHKYCKKADCDRVFIAVDAGGGGAKCLSRVEFMTCLVHIAVLRYVMPGEVKDVSNALHALFSRDIEPRLDPALFTETNTFRRSHCYIEEVDIALKRHEASLRIIFAVASTTDGALSLVNAKLLSWEEWLAMVRKLELVAADLSDRDAKLCFVWSRMCVIDGESARGKIKESHLPFEGFLEALCRLAALKAWPTDDEIRQAGHADAGSYLLYIREEKPQLHDELLRERATPLGGAPPQPIWRCVDHLISLIIRTIEAGTRGSDDLSLTSDEMKVWAKAGRK